MSGLKDTAAFLSMVPAAFSTPLDSDIVRFSPFLAISVGHEWSPGPGQVYVLHLELSGMQAFDHRH